MNLKDFLQKKDLILVGGSGGVGKTTLSAALALQAAQLGRKTVVLTIDPAKRLATSLGLEELTGVPKQVSKDLPLYAMMLDTKRTFDELVVKYAPDKATADSILNNRIYQHLSNLISGSQEYMAMEKLYEFMQEHAYDLVVVDTPPTTNAIDFLEAPERMIKAIGDSMIHLLMKPAMFAGKTGLKIIEKGASLIFKVLDRITGSEFLKDVSVMLFAFEHLLGGFKERATQMRETLSQDGTCFFLVASCEDKSIHEALLFREKLKELKLPYGGIVLNRVYPYFESVELKSASHLSKLKKMVGEGTAEKMRQLTQAYLKQGAKDKKAIQKVKKETDGFALSVPLFDSDIHDREGLEKLGNYLVSL